MNKISRIKNKLRKEMKIIRKSLFTNNKIQINQDVHNNLLALNINKQDIIAGFIALDNEVDISKFLLNLSNKGVRIALPKVINETKMAFYSWDTQQSSLKLHPKLNFYEPTSNEELIPNIILTPLLAFDKNKNRLGYGKGYYDYYFKNLRSALKVGVAAKEQEIDEVPIGNHDMKLDMIITDERVIR